MKTLTAGFLPVLFGSAYALYAWGHFNVQYFVMIAVAMPLIQAATNMFNDYMDFKRGADGADKQEEKALAAGELTPRQMLVILSVYSLAALAIGIVIAVQTSWVVLIVAVAGLCVGILYSSGPKPISYLPLGEAASGLTMGLGITATVVYIQSGQLTWNTLLMAVPTVIYIGTIMFTNNLCDLDADKSAGRRTLPGVLGFRTARAVWVLVPLVLVVVTVVFIILGIYPVWDLVSVLLLLQYRQLRAWWHKPQADFTKRQLMGKIGKLGLLYHLLMVLGLLVAVAAQKI